MANGAFKFKDNSGNVVSFISGSGPNISFSGGTLDLSGMTGLTLGNLTLSGTTQNAVSTSHAASYLLTSSFNSYTGTTNTIIGSLQTSTGSLNTYTSSNNSKLEIIESTTSSLNTFTSSANGRLNSIEGKTGSYATTGSNTFNGNLTVTGYIDAQELRTTYISSSILYRSGSTKFGDELTDTHAFTGSVLISGSLSVPGQNLVTGTGGSTEIAVFSGANTLNGYSGLKYGDPQLTIGLSSAGNNIDYNLLIQRHGTSASPGDASTVPALQVTDYAGNGYTTYQTVAIVDIQTPRISIGDANAGNTNLLRVANDDGTILHISGKGRMFVGQTSQTDNGQLLQVAGTSYFSGDVTLSKITTTAGLEYQVRSTNGASGNHVFKSYNTAILTLDGGTNVGSFTSNLTVGGDFQLLGTNPRIDYPNGSSFRLYQAGVGTKFEVDTGSNFTFYGTGVDSPKISLRGLNYVNAMMGDTTTGTSDVGNLWLYNDGTLRIRLDSDTAGTSYINANKFVIGATASTNARFRVREDNTDTTYTSKIQAVIGPSDYLDSDATDVFGGGTSETQFTSGNASRPAMLSLGGALNVDETLGVINFFRSGNSDNYRSRAQIFSSVQSTGTANQHGAYIEIRTANDGVAAPQQVARFEARGSFMLYRRDDNMTFADSVGALYVRQNGNHDSTQEEFRIVGRNIGFFSHTGTRHVGINSSGILGIGYAGAPAATSKLFISRSDQYGLHFDAAAGYGRIQTTDDNLYLKVGSNDMVTINSSSITLLSTVTSSAAATPNFAILETGVSKTVSGYNYDATQPMAMVITQTAQTTMGLMRASEDTTGATLRGMKARGNASTIASPLNGDDIFSVEGWAWHGAGPNYPKLGGGMKFVKDDTWGTASTRAPMRTEFYNANSTTTIQTTLIIYPSGNASLTGTLTQSASDIRLKTNITKIENALEKINSLEGFTFNWNNISPLYDENVTTKEVGISAQAIVEVLPEVVSLAPFDISSTDGKSSKSGQNYLTVKYEKLVPLLIEGIKEQQVIINDLKSRLEQIENN